MPESRRRPTVLVVVLLLAPTLCLGQEAALALGSPVVELKAEPFGPNKGRQYLKVTVDVTPARAPEKGTNLSTRAECRVDGKTVSDQIMAGTVRLDSLKPGEPAPMPAFLFKARTKYLTGAPESCELTVTYGALLARGKARTLLGAFCWDGRAVRPGGCAGK